MAQIDFKPIDFQPTKKVEKEKKGIARSAAEFLGIEKFGKGIGQSLFSLTPEARELEKRLEAGQISPQEYEEITTGGLTNREVLASAARTALTVGTAGMKAPATGLGRIGASTATGAAFGATKSVEDAQSIKDVVNDLEMGALFGFAGGVAGEAIRFGARKVIPKFLSYTSDTPEMAIQRGMDRPSQVGKLVGKITPEETLKNTQFAVKNLRKTLSQQYDDTSIFIADMFKGKKMKVSPNGQKLIGDVVEEFGIEGAENLDNLGFKEGLNLYKKVNELFTKRAVRESAKGISVRNLQKVLRADIVENFGGTNGVTDKFLKNYAAEKSVFDAANSLARAYELNKPKAQASATNAIQQVFNENKGAYLSAIRDLELATGKDLLDEIAALKVQKVIPVKSGKFGFDELFRAAVFPITSERLVGIETRTLGRLINASKKFGFTQPLKVMLLSAMLKPDKKK